MNIIIKTPGEIEKMRIAGKILAELLIELEARAVVGVSTKELDTFAEEFILARGGTPGFKGYHGFPATLCTALNEVVVHGIPSSNEILKEGDLFTVDCGVIFEGYYADAARSKAIGQVSPEKQKLIETAKLALSRATHTAKPGKHVGDISRVIQKTIEDAGFHVIKDLTGHGIGKSLHEDPYILNYYDGKPGALLKPGMTIAIEPIFATGTSKIITRKDNWTIQTADNSPAVQQENTILITEFGNEVLTAV